MVQFGLHCADQQLKQDKSEIKEFSFSRLFPFGLWALGLADQVAINKNCLYSIKIANFCFPS